MVFLPFPACALFCGLLRWSTRNLGAGNPPGAVPLARNHPQQDSEKYLKGHSDSNEDEDPLGILESAEAGKQAAFGLFIGNRLRYTAIMVGKFPLVLCDVEETSVGSVE